MRAILALLFVCSVASAEMLPPDITVAADGSGNFTTVQQAVQSIPKDNHQRIVILIKDGVYKEKVRIDASCVTLRGQSRGGARIEFPQLDEDFNKKPDDLGRAVVNLSGNDVVFENLTVVNTANVIGPHEFSIFGTGDRTVIVDCDVLSEGADTVSLWRGKDGRYYHARCNFRGAVDFVCPRGWCYITDCHFYETKATAATWHDGHFDQDMKFVLHNCTFDGIQGFNLARHHVDAQFFYLDCTFAKTMIDKPPFRVIYPLAGDKPTTQDAVRNANLAKDNKWGDRAYFYDCHRDSGDYAWMKDNLSDALGAPTPQQVTAAWTFANKWDPERTEGPKITQIKSQGDQIAVVFSESVTVKGKPKLELTDGTAADYSSGSGTDTLLFNAKTADAKSIDLNGGSIVASQAYATILNADLTLKAR